jgi:hypothetical protein
VANKQTRRSVSLNRDLYAAATRVADERGVTLAQLVADALRSSGVEAPRTAHMVPSVVRHAVARRAGVKATVISGHRVLRRISSIARPANDVESWGGGEVCAPSASIEDEVTL